MMTGAGCGARTPSTAGLGRRVRVARVHVQNSRPNSHALGFSEQVATGRNRLAAEYLRDPECVVTQGFEPTRMGDQGGAVDAFSELQQSDSLVHEGTPGVGRSV